MSRHCEYWAPLMANASCLNEATHVLWVLGMGASIWAPRVWRPIDYVCRGHVEPLVQKRIATYNKYDLTVPVMRVRRIGEGAPS